MIFSKIYLRKYNKPKQFINLHKNDKYNKNYEEQNKVYNKHAKINNKKILKS